MTRALALLLVALPLLQASGCSGACRLQETGTVLYLDLEGGFYGIQADSGEKYRPVDLPKTYASHGLRVRFCADPIPGMMGIHMWGVPVTVREIEALGP